MINKVGLFSNFYNVNNSAKVQDTKASFLHSQPQKGCAKDCFIKSQSIAFTSNHQFDYSTIDSSTKRAKVLEKNNDKSGAEQVYKKCWETITKRIEFQTTEEKMTDEALAGKFASLAVDYTCNLLSQGKLKESSNLLTQAKRIANNSFDVNLNCFEKIDELATECDFDMAKIDYMEDDEDFDVAQDSLLEQLKSQSDEPIDDFDELGLLKQIRHEKNRDFNEQEIIRGILPQAPDEPQDLNDDLIASLEAEMAEVYENYQPPAPKKEKIKATMPEIEQLSKEKNYHRLGELSLNGADDLTIKYPITILAIKGKYDYEAKQELINISKQHEDQKIRDFARDKVRQTYSIDS